MTEIFRDMVAKRARRINTGVAVHETPHIFYASKNFFTFPKSEGNLRPRKIEERKSLWPG